MACDERSQMRATRASLDAVSTRVDRIETAMQAVSVRLLLALRVILGGSLLTLIRLFGARDGFHGF